MNKQLAFVLGGGGAHGALQVGALRALFEAGYRPDLVTGTSIGAANAAFLAVHGCNLAGVEKLHEVWLAMAHKDLLPTNLWWQTMRSFFHRSGGYPLDHIREFAIQSGLSPELRFGDLKNVRLYLVASDLNAGCPVIFGQDPRESVLESVLASMSLPPWIAPVEREGRYLMDGAAVSNLPIEAALSQGATEIIALDLMNMNEVNPDSHGLRPFLWKLNQAVVNRQTELELELAAARGVAVRRIALTGENRPPLWDFRQSAKLIEQGYDLARLAMASWPPVEPPGWWQQLRRLPGWDSLLPKRN